MMVSESKIFSFQFCVDWWEYKYFYENERIVQKLNSDDHQTSVVDRLAFIRMITMTMAKDNRLNQKTEVLLYEKGNMQCSIQTLLQGKSHLSVKKVNHQSLRTDNSLGEGHCTEYHEPLHMHSIFQHNLSITNWTYSWHQV